MNLIIGAADEFEAAVSSLPAEPRAFSIEERRPDYEGRLSGTEEGDDDDLLLVS